jgi:hypothetical protein
MAWLGACPKMKKPLAASNSSGKTPLPLYASGKPLQVIHK